MVHYKHRHGLNRESEIINRDCITREGDILVRLSSPYTSVIISEQESGYLVPSHFAIIRVDRRKAVPEYILWTLKKDSTKKKIEQNNSGSSAFGTISSGFFSNLKIRDLPIEQQATIGQLYLLSEKEQKLMLELAEEKKKYNRAIINMAWKVCSLYILSCLFCLESCRMRSKVLFQYSAS